MKFSTFGTVIPFSQPITFPAQPRQGDARYPLAAIHQIMKYGIDTEDTSLEYDNSSYNHRFG